MNCTQTVWTFLLLAFLFLFTWKTREVSQAIVAFIVFKAEEIKILFVAIETNLFKRGNWFNLLKYLIFVPFFVFPFKILKFIYHFKTLLRNKIEKINSSSKEMRDTKMLIETFGLNIIMTLCFVSLFYWTFIAFGFVSGIQSKNIQVFIAVVSNLLLLVIQGWICVNAIRVTRHLEWTDVKWWR